MPVLSLGHSKFWRARANIPIPPPPPGSGGYPTWQASVISGSMLGFLQGYWDKFVYAGRWFLWAWRMQLSVDQWRAVICAVQAVQLPSWPAAQAAVFATSRAEGFHEVQAWNEVSHVLAEQHHGAAENMWRHMRAALEHERQTGPLDNPSRNLLIELAYHEFAASGRGKPTMDR